MTRVLAALLWVALCFCGPGALAAPPAGVPVLCYHRFGPTVADSMTVKTKVFAAQLKWLKDNGYTVIPLRTLVNYLLDKGPAPPPKSVVITADDAHQTVYSDMLPLAKKYNIPVTVFCYPSCVSRVSSVKCMKWEQLKALQKTGLFDIQCHTYWHPNFKKDKKKMKPGEFEKSVHTQLSKSKAVLEKKLGTKVDVLAWPFGIYNPYLEKQAAKAGYVVAFSIDRRFANKSENNMAQPRYLMSNGDGIKGFAAIVSGKVQEKKHRTY